MYTFFKYFVILDYEIIFIDETLYYSCLLLHANQQPQPLFSSNHTLHAYHQQLFIGISHHQQPLSISHSYCKQPCKQPCKHPLALTTPLVPPATNHICQSSLLPLFLYQVPFTFWAGFAHTHSSA